MVPHAPVFSGQCSGDHKGWCAEQIIVLFLTKWAGTSCIQRVPKCHLDPKCSGLVDPIVCELSPRLDASGAIQINWCLNCKHSRNARICRVAWEKAKCSGDITMALQAMYGTSPISTTYAGSEPSAPFNRAGTGIYSSGLASPRNRAPCPFQHRAASSSCASATGSA